VDKPPSFPDFLDLIFSLDFLSALVYYSDKDITRLMIAIIGKRGFSEDS